MKKRIISLLYPLSRRIQNPEKDCSMTLRPFKQTSNERGSRLTYQSPVSNTTQGQSAIFRLWLGHEWPLFQRGCFYDE